MKKLAKYLLEIRFDPSPFILDKRGAIAEAISNQCKFTGWEISNNRIDFYDADRKITAFLSYRNLGIAIPESDDGELDPELAKDFIKSVWTYFPSDKIIRFGVRSLFFVERKSFESLFNKFRSKFLKIDEEKANQLGGDIVDVGFPIHFIIDDVKYNINTGPMKKEQASQFFAVPEEDLPDAGIFLDADYSRGEFEKDPKQKEVLEFIDKGLAKASETRSVIEEMLK